MMNVVEKQYVINENTKIYEHSLQSLGYVKLSDLLKLSKVAEDNNVNRRVLDYRLKFFKEGVDYIRLGSRQPTLLTPYCAERILKLK